MTLIQTQAPAVQDLRTELATLTASRICHDLISPVGAISNGLELVALGGGLSDGPELQLITESCENANARIRFFRVAFGAASRTAMVSAAEVKSILAALTKGTRLSVQWDTTEDVSRADVQLAFLALQCAETALRRGGKVVLSPRDGSVTLTATADQVTCDPNLWHRLDAPHAPGQVMGTLDGVTPAQVQFALLPMLAADGNRPITVQSSDTQLVLTV